MRPRLSKIWKGGQHLHDKIYHPKRKYISSLTNLMWPVCQAAVVVFFFFVFLLSYLTIANKVGDNGIRRETSYVNEQNSEGLQNDKEYPRIAYVIMGGQGDSDRILRLLGRIYDQQNIYAIHYDNRAPDSEFQALKQEINTCDGMCRNVHLLPRYVAMPQDITMVDVEISGMAYLLNLSKDWEYVVGLSSSHYPLYPQSYIRGVLGMLPKHASMFKYYQAPCMKGTGNSVLVDGGETSQSTKRSGNLDVKRPLNPDYSYYVGSQWHVLSRKFAEYLVLSPDGLARRVLLYFANVAKPDEYYFQTVACSSKEHRKYVLNYTFHYDDRNKLLQDPDNKWSPATIVDDTLINAYNSGALFALQFGGRTGVIGQKSEKAMKIIDSLILNETSAVRINNEVVNLNEKFKNVLIKLQESINSAQQTNVCDLRMHECRDTYATLDKRFN
eukprot:TRINITY_DN1549_c0_g1_i7.p1 TRINITY_DN1549_c0_g1~~TRINITY_DN1549_c0_g1_i7.p1  ORF type:complete len:473 (-),score=33.90 TRINITY_DN1549_c0_g1_i7:236-1561(-)